MFVLINHWLVLLLPLMFGCFSGVTSVARNGGDWAVLLNSSGVVAMHMALTHRNTVLIFDQTAAGRSGLRFNDHCDGADPKCWVHSVEYDLASNSIRPLVLQTDTWCSSGAFLSSGTLAQTGGYGDGIRVIRYFSPCTDRRCDWQESSTTFLAADRWYATDHILPDEDRVIVVGGRDAYSYEFVPKSSSGEGVYDLPFLRETDDRQAGGNNLYPFVHLSSDGNLFVFANRDSILLDYRRNRVVRRFPRMPGNGPRSYPSTGSSVMLPLEHGDGFKRVEVMVCGGARNGSYSAARRNEFMRGLSSCGRIVITSKHPTWTMEEMPGRRIMPDMLILPTGNVLIINGATHGCAGWWRATNPSLRPYLYEPKNKTFTIMRSSRIPRMYHSSAVVIPSGMVLVGGSNPNRNYTFSGEPFPTELRIEVYAPPYMDETFNRERAWHVVVGRESVGYGEEFDVSFELDIVHETLELNVYAPPFASHSLSMSQRLVKLEHRVVGREGTEFHVVASAPPSAIVAPAGYYLLTVVNGGIPSRSVWLRFSRA